MLFFVVKDVDEDSLPVRSGQSQFDMKAPNPHPTDHYSLFFLM